MQGQPLYLPPPVESMEGIWNPQIKAQVDAFLALSVTGGPASIKSKLQALISQIPADELMFTNDISFPIKLLKKSSTKRLIIINQLRKICIEQMLIVTSSQPQKCL